MKQSTPFRSRTYGTGTSNLGANIAQGSNMANQRYQNKVKLPNQHDNDAQLFSKIGKNFSKPNDRPRGVFNNLATGLAEGLEHGAKSKAINERKEEFSKYDKVMNYLEETNNAAIEQNQWYEKRESARKELMPQVLAYMENIDRLDPQSQRIMAQDMLGQYGQALGEDFKLSSIDGSNPFLMTVQSEKGQQLFDLRTMFAGDDAMQQSIAMKMPEYQMRLQEDREYKKRQLDIQEKAVNAKYPTPVNNDYGSIPISSVKGTAARTLMNTVNAEMNLAKDIPIVLQQLDEAEKIMKDNPKIGSGFNNYLSKGSVTKAYMEPKLRAAYEKINKLSDRVVEAYIKAKGTSITDKEREIIKAGLFDSSLLPESSEFNIKSIRKELGIALERGKFAAEELANGKIASVTSFDKYMKSKNDGNELNDEDDNLWNSIGEPIQ